MSAARCDVDVRAAQSHDRDAILALLQASLGWVPDAAFAAFFAWKHEQSPFGASPSWVAVDGARIVGFRTFMRWEFADDERVVQAVRAVDTATHPDYQGRGIFSRLTQHALAALRADDVDFVFNTPNEKSRSGYLKMGWQVVGRLPVSIRVRSPASLPRVLGARVPAGKWSIACAAGVAASVALANASGVAELLASRADSRGLATRRSPEFLQWRYGFEPLQYRVIHRGRGVEDGIAIFRLRRRGRATEAVLCDVLVPGQDVRAEAQLARDVARQSGADYVLRLDPRSFASGFVNLPRQGPILTWRGVHEDAPPSLRAWNLGMGDVELF